MNAPERALGARSGAFDDEVAGRLLVCATPIGNLGDVTARVVDALASADLVACEDTRRTRTLLDHLGLRARTTSLHEHNEAARAGELLARVAAGETVVLVSDAGMPVVSDPGARLVAAARDGGHRVEVLPGASAPATAIATAGLPADRWRFVGFLPRRADEILAVLRSAETTVAFESPRRLAATLAAIVADEPARPVCVCRELTKLHEEVVRGPASEVAARFPDGAVRGEVTLVVAGVDVPDGASAVDLGEAVAAVARLAESGARAKAAAREVAALTGHSANALYRALHER